MGQGAELLAVFSPPSGSICIQDSAAAGSPHLAVERLFSDSGIQRIIDKYTKELNFSLCSPGRPTGKHVDGLLKGFVDVQPTTRAGKVIDGLLSRVLIQRVKV